MLGPIWISTDVQTMGRGRRGRDWVSQTGNLFCTGLYTFDGALADAAKLSFAAALALAETLDHYIDPALVSIKWPNDVMVGGEKVAGILLESGTYEGKIWLAIGMGVNLLSSPKADDYSTTHLLAHISAEKLEGPEVVFSGTQPMIELLAARFEHWRELYLEYGFFAAPHGLADPRARHRRPCHRKASKRHNRGHSSWYGRKRCARDKNRNWQNRKNPRRGCFLFVNTLYELGKEFLCYWPLIAAIPIRFLQSMTARRGWLNGVLKPMTPRTADEYAVWLFQLMQMQGFQFSDLTDCIISTVVPQIIVSYEKLGA